MRAADPGAKTRWTSEELSAESRRRFGDSLALMSFQCPTCGDIADPSDFLLIAGDPNPVGQECIGRHLERTAPGGRPARGCDWTAYGLIRGPWQVELRDHVGELLRTVPSFPLAPSARDLTRSDEERAEVDAAWAARGNPPEGTTTTAPEEGTA